MLSSSEPLLRYPGQSSLHLTTVPLTARKKRMEKKAPSTLSAMKKLLAWAASQPSSLGMAGGSTKRRVPDRKRVALKSMPPPRARSCSSRDLFRFFSPAGPNLSKMQPPPLPPSTPALRQIRPNNTMVPADQNSGQIGFLP